MVTSSLIDLFFTLVNGVLDGIAWIPTPEPMLEVLGTITCYGSWIVGAEYLTTIMSVIVLWLTVRFTLGVVIFIWDLLPLT